MAWLWPPVLGTASLGYGTDLTRLDFGSHSFWSHNHCSPHRTLLLHLLLIDDLVFFIFLRPHYPTFLQSVKEVRTNSEEPPLALCLSGFTSDSRWGTDCVVYSIYLPFFVLVCITYALLTLCGCSGVWILVMGGLTVPVFFSCLFLFSLSSITVLFAKHSGQCN